MNKLTPKPKGRKKKQKFSLKKVFGKDLFDEEGAKNEIKSEGIMTKLKKL